MAYSRLTNTKFLTLRLDGSPNSYGTLESFVSGTATHIPIYSDDSGTPYANPATFDANGLLEVWLDITRSYRFVVKDSDGNTLPYGGDNITAISGNGSAILHSTLAGLDSDDHEQYSLADGTRDYTGPVKGVAGTDSAHLVTKAQMESGAVLKSPSEEQTINDFPLTIYDEGQGSVTISAGTVLAQHSGDSDGQAVIESRVEHERVRLTKSSGGTITIDATDSNAQINGSFGAGFSLLADSSIASSTFQRLVGDVISSSSSFASEGNSNLTCFTHDLDTDENYESISSTNISEARNELKYELSGVGIISRIVSLVTSALNSISLEFGEAIAKLQTNATDSRLELTKDGTTKIVRDSNNAIYTSNNVEQFRSEADGTLVLQQNAKKACATGTPDRHSLQTLEGQCYITKLEPNAQRDYVKIFSWTNTRTSVAWKPSFRFRVRHKEVTYEVTLLLSAASGGNLTYSNTFGACTAKYLVTATAVATLAVVVSGASVDVWVYENSADDFTILADLSIPSDGSLNTTTANQTTQPASSTIVRAVSDNEGKAYVNFYASDGVRNYNRLFVFDSQGAVSRNLETISFLFETAENRVSGMLCFKTDTSGNISLSSTNPGSLGSYGTSGVYATVQVVISGNYLALWYYDTGVNDKCILRSMRLPSDFGIADLTQSTSASSPGGSSFTSTNDPYMRH